jgi:hypothetical protein
MSEKKSASLLGTCVRWEKGVQYDTKDIIYHPRICGRVFFVKEPVVGTDDYQDLRDNDKLIESDAYDVLGL